eukprot:NODE_1144_length_1055_cov_292.992048_g787_i0.p1 GENE.NODE_1144_length_1055_cov_292.992048_g787_i0~~NODE_1144_length_1055_cov_292.992048_g787_i0.p1  ORF type:complete len:241 (+),score=17.45 NODE_1144_length_1055_cov_292.992048_g787_i0:160-882(+)
MQDGVLWLALLVVLSLMAPTTAQTIDPLSANRTCRDMWIKNNSLPNGWYPIDPASNNNTFTVYCDMISQGWTRVEPIFLDYYTRSPVDVSTPLDDPDQWLILQMQFTGWGSPPAYLPLNFTYNITEEHLQALKDVATEAKQELYFHCIATQPNATYGCTVDPVFYPSHQGFWRDWTWQPITPQILNDGCCFGCCRNAPRWDKSLIRFTQQQNIPVRNVEVRHSGAPGERLLVEPFALWFF